MPVFVRHYVVITLCLAASILLAPPPVSAQDLDIEVGRAHLEAYRLKEALRIIEPLAERGNADAQYLLGNFHEKEYYRGDHHTARALNWYLKSANSGNLCARRRIVESMFFDGHKRAQKPIEISFEWGLLNDWPTVKTFTHYLWAELSDVRSMTSFDLEKPFGRRRFIMILVWGRLLDKNDVFRIDYEFFKLAHSIKHNEHMIAELLSEAIQSGDLWRWLAEVRADWPINCVQ